MLIGWYKLMNDEFILRIAVHRQCSGPGPGERFAGNVYEFPTMMAGAKLNRLQPVIGGSSQPCPRPRLKGVPMNQGFNSTLRTSMGCVTALWLWGGGEVPRPLRALGEMYCDDPLP